MKLRVVAWCDYDEELPCGDNGWAAHNAIIDNIQANGYDFFGMAHVDGSNCTPLLNDGKKYCFSQQGWSDLMTEAHRFYDAKDYADYYIPDRIDEYFGGSKLNKHRPQYTNISKVVAEKDLNETIEISVSQKQFDRAAKKGDLRYDDFYRAVNEGKPYYPDCDKLRYVYKGDTLVLVCNDQRATYLVTDAERKHVNNTKKRQELEPIMHGEDRVAAKRASWEYRLSTLTLVIKLAKPGE